MSDIQDSTVLYLAKAVEFLAKEMRRREDQNDEVKEIVNQVVTSIENLTDVVRQLVP